MVSHKESRVSKINETKPLASRIIAPDSQPSAREISRTPTGYTHGHRIPSVPYPRLPNMSIAFSCPDCGKKYNVPESMAGRKAKCSGCGVMMQIANTVAITERPSARSRGAARDEADDWQEEESPRKKRASRQVVDDDELDDDEPIRKRRKGQRKPAKKSGATVFVVLAIGL